MADFVEDEQPRVKSKQSRDKNKKTKSQLLEEIDILLECLSYGRLRFKEFPELNIKNSSEIKPRIKKLIYLLMK